jgi:uncharacterized alkaline shock family protein YloU
VRKAALGSYGVAAVSGPHWFDRPLAWLGLAIPGVRVRNHDRLRVEVNLALFKGVPAAAVASNVTKAVRYVVQRDLGRTIDEVVVLEEGWPLSPTTPSASGRPRRKKG